MVFQRIPGLQKGNILAVLDGIPAPVVLEEVEEGGKDRIKVVTHVVAIAEVKLSKLVELGLCQRKVFKII